MRLQFLLILLIQVVLVESNEVIGYLGHSITLSSGGISGNLSNIKWSIFSNSTWIATYQNERTNTERFSQYKGRLGLNISTGDLTIHKLTEKDAMEYTVDLINTEKQTKVHKIQLKVIERLQRPAIETLINKSTEEGCLSVLLCTSTDKGVVFDWRIEPSGVANLTMSNPAVLSLLRGTQIHVNITCISKRDEENASSAVTRKCDDVKPQIQLQLQCRERSGLHILLGTFLGVAIAGIIYACKDVIKKAKDSLSEKLCSSNHSS